jgi:hypothetical protein
MCVSHHFATPVMSWEDHAKSHIGDYTPQTRV